MPRAKSKSAGKTGLPTKFIQLAEDCALLSKWEQRETLGSGEYGTTFKVCYAGDCQYVLKIQDNDRHFRSEIEVLEQFQDTDVVPKLYAAWTCKNRAYIVMESLLPYQREDYYDNMDVYKQLRRALAILNSRGWIHSDIHRGNVMHRSNGTLVLIDFGLAVKDTHKDADIFYNDQQMMLESVNIDDRLWRQYRSIHCEYDGKSLRTCFDDDGDDDDSIDDRD